MNKEILHNLLADLAISYRIIANDKDKIRLSKYHQALNDFLIEDEILHSKIDKAIEYIDSTGYGTDFSMSAEEVDELYKILKEDK